MAAKADSAKVKVSKARSVSAGEVDRAALAKLTGPRMSCRGFIVVKVRMNEARSVRDWSSSDEHQPLLVLYFGPFSSRAAWYSTEGE